MSDELPATAFAALPPPREIPSSGGVRLATYDLGGDGDDLLMVHATGFCAGVWSPMAAHLDHHRIAALDVRGHGRSSVPAGGMAWEGTADDVLATIDTFGLHDTFGVGHSMGGASLVLAELTRPGTFRGLWLYEPIIFPREIRSQQGENPLSVGARRRRTTFDSPRTAYENFSSKPPFDVLDPAALAAYVDCGFDRADDGSVTLRCRPEIEAQTYEMGARHDAMDHLGELRCPVTVLSGRIDVPGPATIAALIADRLPRGRLEQHPELGHFGPLEAPAEMAESVRDAVTALS